ncbi:hypothetical protein HDZ31DRAFT_78030, partial [Schizophyllum fasciatum]
PDESAQEVDQIATREIHSTQMKPDEATAGPPQIVDDSPDCTRFGFKTLDRRLLRRAQRQFDQVWSLYMFEDVQDIAPKCVPTSERPHLPPISLVMKRPMARETQIEPAQAEVGQARERYGREDHSLPPSKRPEDAYGIKPSMPCSTHAAEVEGGIAGARILNPGAARTSFVPTQYLTVNFVGYCLSNYPCQKLNRDVVDLRRPVHLMRLFEYIAVGIACICSAANARQTDGAAKLKH